MNITFVSADDTIRMTFGIDPWSAVTDLTKIEKELGKDLTDIIQKVIDVAFNVTSPTFTRGPKDAYVVSYSWEMQPIIGGAITKDNALKSLSITAGDSDHNIYKFEDVEDRDVDVMITWLRKEHNVYYTPNDELLNEKKKVEDLRTQLAAKDTQIDKLNELNVALSNDRQCFFKFRSDIAEISGIELLCGDFEENSKKMIDELKKKLNANDFYVESEWEADYRKFVQQIFEALGTPCLDEVIHTNYLAAQALEAVKTMKKEHDLRATRLLNDEAIIDLKTQKIKKLEKKLEDAEVRENWYMKTNRDLALERDHYKDLYEDLERSSAVDIDDLNEWRSALSNLYEDVMNEAPDFDSHPTLLTKRLYEAFHHNRCELNKLSEFKAKLAEVIKLPEDQKRDATTEDYISSFEHTKGEWRKMEIKLANYERENKHLLERNHVLSASNGAFDVLRNLHDSIIGPCDFDDSPQILGVRIIDKFNRVKAEEEELKTDYTNAKCARAELAYLYKRTFDVGRLDPSLSPHEITDRIRKRMGELEWKLSDIKDICDENSDVMNIIGE